MDREGITLILGETACTQLPWMQLLQVYAGNKGCGKGKAWDEQTSPRRVDAFKGICLCR
jgi:hypothetical protein